MKQREKLLAILAVVAILLWQGMPLYTHFFVTPVEELQGDVRRLGDEVTQRERTDRTIRRARTNMTKWKSASLPPDWRNAQRLYLEWLTDVAKMAGFSDLKVTHTPGREGKVFTPVRVSLEAKVGYDQLCRFLDRFQKADLLHRLAEMNIKKEEAGGGTKLGVTLVAESLALAGAEKRNFLFPQTTFKDELSRDGTTVAVESAEAFPKKNEFLARSGNEILHVKSVDGANWTVERAAEATSADSHRAGDTIELFHVVSNAKSKGTPAVAIDEVIAQSLFVKPDQAGPQDPFESDYAKNTYLRTLWQGEQWEGWLYSKSGDKDEKTVLREGSTFQIANLTATVVEFKPDHVVVDVDNEKRQLRLGANLQSMGKNARRGMRGSGRGGFGRGERGGRRGGGDGSRRGRGRGDWGNIDMNDPAVREKMEAFRKKMREARERGEMPDFGDFGGDFGGPAEAPGNEGGDAPKSEAKDAGETKADDTKSDKGATEDGTADE